MQIGRLSVLFLVLFVGLVASAPSDYLELVSNTPNCGAFDIPVCETVYKIKNPSMISSSAIDQNNFKLFFQELGGRLEEETTNLQGIKLEYFNGVKWTTLDKKNFNLPMLPNSNNLLRITAKKVWKPTGYLNEEKIENVDNIIGLFGYNYTEYAWWNSSYTYRRSVTITADAASSGSVWILSQNLTQIMQAGKLDAQGTCARITGVDETTLLFMENKYANLTNMNATYLVLNDTIAAGTNTRYLYYSNLTNCPYDATFRMSAYNYSGLMKAMWYINNTVNQSQQPDYPDFQNNYTHYGTVTTENSGGVGYTPRYENSGSISKVGTRFNNLLQGTVIVKFASWVTGKEIITRGAIGGNDFQVYHQGGGTPQPLFFQIASGPGITSTSGLALSTYYIAGISWNATGYQMYIDGIFNTSSANTSLILPNAPTKNLAFGLLEGYALQNLTGYIPFALFFNRTLSGSEQKLLASYGNEPLGSEITQNTSGNIVLNSYDQITGSGIITNITISNSTYSVQLNGSQTYTADFVNLPNGLVTVVFSNSSYYQSVMSFVISNVSQTINGYLLPLSLTSVNNINFYVQTQTQSPLPNALVQISRLIGSTTQIVGSCYTDSTGACSFYMDQNSNYVVSISAFGYTNQTNTIRPTSLQYTFVMSSSTSVVYDGDYDGITVMFGPEYLDFIKNWTIINYTIIASNGDLGLFGLNISYNGAVIYNYTNTTSPYGGVSLLNLSTVGKFGNVTAIGFFQKPGQTIQYNYKYYLILQNVSNSNSSLTQISLGLKGGDGGTTLMVLFIVFVAMIIVSAATKFMPIALGGGILGAAVLGFFAFFVFPDSSAAWTFMVGLFILGYALVHIRTNV